MTLDKEPIIDSGPKTLKETAVENAAEKDVSREFEEHWNIDAVRKRTKATQWVNRVFPSEDIFSLEGKEKNRCLNRLIMFYSLVYESIQKQLGSKETHDKERSIQDFLHSIEEVKAKYGCYLPSIDWEFFKAKCAEIEKQLIELAKDDRFNPNLSEQERINAIFKEPVNEKMKKAYIDAKCTESQFSELKYMFTFKISEAFGEYFKPLIALAVDEVSKYLKEFAEQNLSEEAASRFLSERLPITPEFYFVAEESKGDYEELKEERLGEAKKKTEYQDDRINIYLRLENFRNEWQTFHVLIHEIVHIASKGLGHLNLFGKKKGKFKKPEELLNEITTELLTTRIKKRIQDSDNSDHIQISGSDTFCGYEELMKSVSELREEKKPEQAEELEEVLIRAMISGQPHELNRFLKNRFGFKTKLRQICTLQKMISESWRGHRLTSSTTISI